MRDKVSRYLLFFVLMLLFWIVLASKTDWQTLFIGAIISSIVVYYNRDIISKNSRRFKVRFKHILNFVVFLPILLLEIIKANISVALIVLNPKLPINPCVTTIKTNIKSDILKVILSNCITLTPGTLTLQNNNDEILVHCLTNDAKEGLKGWKIHEIISKFEEG